MSRQQHPDLDRALQLASDLGATDAFLIAGEPLTVRVNDQLKQVETPPYSPELLHDIATAAVGPDRLASLPTTGHAFTSVHLPGVASAQLTAATVAGQLTLTLRLIPSIIPTPAEIALPRKVLDASTHKSGLILFSGHVGSGKTTSAYTLLSHINATQSRLISTVEEPIAFSFPVRRPLILQREVGTDVPDFATGVVSAIRQDADVIFVGELRSTNDIDISLTAASLNRLIISQTHARTAARALHRLIEVQPPDNIARARRQLAEFLLVSVAQTLLPRADGKGKVAAYDVLTPDADFCRALADGRNPLVRSTPLARSLSITDHLRVLAEAGTITPSTADAAIADYLPLVDPSFWA